MAPTRSPSAPPTGRGTRIRRRRRTPGAVDATAPETTIDAGPAGTTASTEATFAFTSNEADVSFACALDGAAYAACSSPTQYPALGDGEHTFAVRATDAAGNVDPTPATRTWTVDATAPTLTSTLPADGAADVAATASVTVTFSEAMDPATLTETTFTLVAQDGAESVTAAVSYEVTTDTATLDPEADLEPGTLYTTTVTTAAADAAGNPLAAAETWSFTTVAPADTSPPETTIESIDPPAQNNRTNRTTVTFTFLSSEEGATFECRLDGGAFAACVSPHEVTGLGDGEHTFEVRAIDAAGNVDLTPASRTWTIDATAPSVAKIGPADGAAGVAVDASAAAVFSEAMDAASLTMATFTLVRQGTTPVASQVIYDAASKRATLNPDGSLVAGAIYTATVKGGPGGAKDAAGNPLAADKTWMFTTASTTSTVAVEADAWVESANPGLNHGTELSLNIDNSPLSEGFLRFTVSGADGISKATLRLYAHNGTNNGPKVYAVDAVAGNSWTETGITWGNKPARGGTPVDTGAIASNTWVEYDVTPLISANGTYTLNLVPDSSDLLQVRAREYATDPTLLPHLVLTVAAPGGPGTAIDTAPADPTDQTSATFTFTSDAPNATFECKIDNGQLAACASPHEVTGLGDGAHTFEVRAIDEAGNPDETPATHSWTIDTAPPTVTTVVPADGATNAPSTTNVEATFSEAMDPATLTAATFALAPQGGGPAVAATAAYDAATRTATLDPDADLAPGTAYTATVTTGATDAAGNPLASDRVWAFTTTPLDPVLLAAGDIASCSSKGDEQTAALLDGLAGTVAALGDLAYEDGTAAEFRDCYDPTWGRLKARTRPAVGNHEYHTAGAAGYFDYFGAAAGDPGKGYYSYDLGEWHIVVLNSMCDEVGGCGVGSPGAVVTGGPGGAPDRLHARLLAPSALQLRRRARQRRGGPAALASPLRRRRRGPAGRPRAQLRALCPMDASGNRDTAHGIREFVAGMGGNTLYGFGTILPNSEKHNSDSLGVLQLTLRSGGYDWKFVPVAGASFTDSGSGKCHAPPPTRAFGVEADAMVASSSPTTNYGTTTFLKVDSSPESEAYVRFNVSGLPGEATSAKLRLYKYNSVEKTEDGPEVYLAGNDWTEGGITWNNKPARTRVLDDLVGEIPATATWVEFDVTSAVTGDGTYTFVLVGDHQDSIPFYSRNHANAGRHPQLVVTSDPLVPRVAAAPLSGDYDTRQDVTLTPSEPATIYYTTDGSDPTYRGTSATYHAYTGPIAVPGSRTLKFVAVAPDGRASPVKTEVYKIHVTAGYRDFYYGGTGVAEPTGDKTESKLWVHDGSWWGVLYDNTAGEYRIHRLDPATQTWVNTGPTVDAREDSRADVLWDGTKLYVATGTTVVSEWGSPPTAEQLAAGSAELLRFSYNPILKTYTQDLGFPVTIRAGSAESMTLAKDSTGRLWITFTRDSKVWVNHSNASGGGDADWGEPFVPAVAGTAVDYDDISAIIAFGGDKVGLMWSNQDDRRFYFAVHNDGDPADVWQATETAHGGGQAGCGFGTGGGTGCANDHLNLKATADGRVFAGVKTANRTTGQPMVRLLVRGASGGWTGHTFSKVEDEHSRPRVLIDEEHGRLYLLATIPELGQGIYYKSTCLDDISFDDQPGPGTSFIQRDDSPMINNATSTKQNLTGASGMVVLAGDSTTKLYSHNRLDLNAAPACS